jgi:uncharacterized protein YbjT (DUF2867 family)
MRVLLTGATGTLGRHLTTDLQAARHELRALSRREQPALPGVDWMRGDLRTGEGLDAAVAGIDTIVHAATHGGLSEGKTRLRYIYRHPGHTDVEGTRRLMDAARRAGVRHVVYTSVVGVDRVPFGYWKSKLLAEEIIASSEVPFTHARITQFHELVDGAIRYALRFPVAMLPRRQQVQPIDPEDASRFVAPLLDFGPVNGVVEFGGPERTTYGDAADAWLAARGHAKRIRTLPMPGRLGRALNAGALCSDDRSGSITWAQWLKAHPREAS